MRTGGFRSGFTLLEILIAFAVLAVGLTLITAAIGRHLAALQILETSLSARQVAQARMVREITRRADELEIPADPSEERFNPRIETVSVVLETDPLRGLEMEQVTSEVSWAVRQQPRGLQLSAGFTPSQRGRVDRAPSAGE